MNERGLEAAGVGGRVENCCPLRHNETSNVSNGMVRQLAQSRVEQNHPAVVISDLRRFAR
jgi:hypothetical protein